METCRTKPILDKFSGCLVESPTCNYACRYGFSYYCEHPDHLSFVKQGESADLSEQYHQLRLSRRKQLYNDLIKTYPDNQELLGLFSCLFQTD